MSTMKKIATSLGGILVGGMIIFGNLGSKNKVIITNINEKVLEKWKDKSGLHELIEKSQREWYVTDPFYIDGFMRKIDSVKESKENYLLSQGGYGKLPTYFIKTKNFGVNDGKK